MEYFNLDCKIKNIKEDFYKKFIKRLLTKKLKKIYLYLLITKKMTLKFDYYSLNELKEIYPNINNNGVIKIERFNDMDYN